MAPRLTLRRLRAARLSPLTAPLRVNLFAAFAKTRLAGPSFICLHSGSRVFSRLFPGLSPALTPGRPWQTILGVNSFRHTHSAGRRGLTSPRQAFVMTLSPAAAIVAALGILAAAPAAYAQPAGPAAAPPGLVAHIKVLPDQAPDCTSLKSIAQSVTRGCMNNDQKAVAIYNFMQLSHYHRQYPSEPAGVPVLKEINTYGWSLCGGLHAEQSALWRELGWDWRFVGWNGHTTVEAKYDGRWHYLDVFLKFYAWMPDGSGGRTLAGEDDLNANPQALILDAFALDPARRCVYRKDYPFVVNDGKASWRAPSFLACGDTIRGRRFRPQNPPRRRALRGMGGD